MFLIVGSSGTRSYENFAFCASHRSIQQKRLQLTIALCQTFQMIAFILQASAGVSIDVWFSPHQDENDVYILTKVSDILHAVFRSYKEKVLPWFEQLLPLVVQLIVSPPPDPQSQFHHQG